MYTWNANPALWKRGAQTCSTCGVVWVERGTEDRAGCAGFTLRALNAHFSCCKCAKSKGWGFFEECGCDFCKQRLHVEEEEALLAARVRTPPPKPETPGDEQKYPALARARALASGREVKFSLLSSVRGRIKEAEEEAVREAIKRRVKTAVTQNSEDTLSSAGSKKSAKPRTDR